MLGFTRWISVLLFISHGSKKAQRSSEELSGYTSSSEVCIS